MTVADGQPIHLVLKNTIERIAIQVADSSGTLVNASALSLKVYDQSENLLIIDDFTGNTYGDNPPTAPSHIVHPSTGNYYFPFGDTSFDADNNTTSTAQEYLFVWNITVAGGEPANVVQVAKVVSVRTMRRLPRLRLIIDKAVKIVDENPDDPVFTGYTDSMLVSFLEGGLGFINAAQPYPMWSSIDDFPDQHFRILLDAAVCDALTSQELFAVDTDANFSDQGNVFVIDHQPKLSAILNATWQRLTQMVPPMKKHYLHNGGVRVELGPSVRFQTLLNASPSGALYRNMFLASSSF